jgi:class 3 adenylate cyclase
MSRRLLAVAFLDLVGWTSLAERVDPEPLQALLERYYEACAEAVADHGGEIEKFIGDAVMAVFGAVTAQEDDVLRALHSALRIRDAVHALRSPVVGGPRLQIHCGIAAGEALVTRSPLAGLRVVGDVVNLAARLQATAAPGQILLNGTAASLARSSFALSPVPPLTLKGKSEPVPAFVALGPAAPAPPVTSMVNRHAERARLVAAYEQVRRERRARLVTVLGPLGIGKTRLVRTTAEEMTRRSAGPSVSFGSCPSYGSRDNHTALTQILGTLIDEAPGRRLIADSPRIATVVDGLRAQDRAEPGRAGTAAVGPAHEEAAWSARELLGAAAADRAQLVVWDGLERAGRSLLQIIAMLQADLASLPLLMVCVGRPELKELAAPWLPGPGEADLIEVRGLHAADSLSLARSLTPPEPQGEVVGHGGGQLDRIVDYSAGNPLFIRLLLEDGAPGGSGEDLPPTVAAAVGAMIDRLPEPAQELIGAASVIGPAFTSDQLALLGVLAPRAVVAKLVDRQLIGTDDRPGGYRFIQPPVQEIVYQRLNKERRLSWHRALATGGLSPAFHFEAAVRLLADLRPSDLEMAAAARAAARALLADGTRALRRRDLPSAIDLLERALGQAERGGDPHRATAAVRLSDALLLSGNAQGAEEIVARTAARMAGEPGRWACVAQAGLLAARRGAGPHAPGGLASALDRNGADRLAWSRLEQSRMLAELGSGRFAGAETAACAALAYARELGDEYEQDRMHAALCEIRQWSPTPIGERLADCADLLRRFADDRCLTVPVLAAQARALALGGDAAAARAALAAAECAVTQLRLTLGRVVTEQTRALVCSLEGGHGEARRHYLNAAAVLEKAAGPAAALSLRVRAAREGVLGRLAGAAGADLVPELAELSTRASQMDAGTRILFQSATVLADASAGRRHPGLAGAAQPAGGSDDPCLRADAFFDLARAHRELGDEVAACAAAQAAAGMYTSIGADCPAQTVRGWM